MAQCYNKNRWVQDLSKTHKDKSRFLIVGDIHGCYDEFIELCVNAGFSPYNPKPEDLIIHAGDLVDRGPRSADVLGFFIHELGISVLGNHDYKLLKHYVLGKGNPSKSAQATINEIKKRNEDNPYFMAAVRHYLENLPIIIQGNQFIVVHGAYYHSMINDEIEEVDVENRTVVKYRPEPQDGNLLSYALYGQTTGKKDEFGYPVRSTEWIKSYQGTKDIIVGHNVVNPCPDMIKAPSGAKLYSIDGGCCFGGDLVGIEYPSRKIHRVKAKKVYHESRSNLT